MEHQDYHFKRIIEKSTSYLKKNLLSSMIRHMHASKNDTNKSLTSTCNHQRIQYTCTDYVFKKEEEAECSKPENGVMLQSYTIAKNVTIIFRGNLQCSSKSACS